jgi:hypothetical protein
MNLDDARTYLTSLLPPGIEKLWDLDPDGDFYLLFDACAELLLTYAFDTIDQLRQEIFPGTVVQKLPDWEVFLGISKYFIARFGTLAQRQQAVVSKIRERGAFCDPTVQAVLAPLFGYLPTTPLEVLRADKSGLRLLHTYSSGILWTIGATSTDQQTVKVLDGGRVSSAGARVIIEVDDSNAHTFTATLTGPDGTAQTFDVTVAAGTAILVLWANACARKGITGYWTLSVTTLTGGSLPIIWSLFVEGIGPGQDTGGATWHWGVYADPAHVGEAGFSDLASAAAAIARIKHSHDVGTIVTSLEPWPGVETGPNAAIPGMCIPSAAT